MFVNQLHINIRTFFRWIREELLDLEPCIVLFYLFKLTRNINFEFLVNHARFSGRIVQIQAALPYPRTLVCKL